MNWKMQMAATRPERVPTEGLRASGKRVSFQRARDAYSKGSHVHGAADNVGHTPKQDDRDTPHCTGKRHCGEQIGGQRGLEARLTEATLLGHERGTLEGVLDNVDVQDLQTDVTVQSGRDRAGDEREHIADRLPGVLRNTLVGQRERELALHRVDVDTVDEVADDDETLKW